MGCQSPHLAERCCNRLSKALKKSCAYYPQTVNCTLLYQQIQFSTHVRKPLTINFLFPTAPQKIHAEFASCAFQWAR